MVRPSKDLQPSDTKWFSPEDFEFLCFNFAREHLTFDEPIPDYSTRDSALLESSLGSPKQTFGGNLLYPTLIKQAAILFYSLIKNHPFKNGNKRIAVMSLLAFLSLNGKWILIDPKDLYALALHVSGTGSKEKDKILKMIENNLENNLIEFDEMIRKIKDNK